MSFEVENDMDGEIGDIGTRPSKFQNRKKSLADLLTGGYNLSGSNFQVKGIGFSLDLRKLDRLNKMLVSKTVTNTAVKINTIRKSFINEGRHGVHCSDNFHWKIFIRTGYFNDWNERNVVLWFTI